MVEIFKDDQKGLKKDQADQLDTPDVKEQWSCNLRERSEFQRLFEVPKDLG